jgi:hypothetical protein
VIDVISKSLIEPMDETALSPDHSTWFNDEVFEPELFNIRV